MSSSRSTPRPSSSSTSSSSHVISAKPKLYQTADRDAAAGDCCNFATTSVKSGTSAESDADARLRAEYAAVAEAVGEDGETAGDGEMPRLTVSPKEFFSTLHRFFRRDLRAALALVGESSTRAYQLAGQMEMAWRESGIAAADVVHHFSDFLLRRKRRREEANNNEAPAAVTVGPDKTVLIRAALQRVIDKKQLKLEAHPLMLSTLKFFANSDLVRSVTGIPKKEGTAAEKSKIALKADSHEVSQEESRRMRAADKQTVFVRTPDSLSKLMDPEFWYDCRDCRDSLSLAAKIGRDGTVMKLVLFEDVNRDRFTRKILNSQYINNVAGRAGFRIDDAQRYDNTKMLSNPVRAKVLSLLNVRVGQDDAGRSDGFSPAKRRRRSSSYDRERSLDLSSEQAVTAALRNAFPGARDAAIKKNFRAEVFFDEEQQAMEAFWGAANGVEINGVKVTVIFAHSFKHN